MEDARNAEHLLRKAAGNAWSQPEERRHVAMRPTNGKARDVELPKAAGAHIRMPCVLMSGTEPKTVFCAGFQPILPHLPFGMGMPTLYY